jgi:hypothetical protein
VTTPAPRRLRRSLSLAARLLRAGGLAASLTAAMAVAPASAAADDPPKRELPDYEGRPPPAPSAGDVALWIPRIVFSPVYFTTEFLIRRPLGALLTWAERSNVPSVLYDFFAFGPNHKAGFAPLVFIDFGFNPSVGLYAFWIASACPGAGVSRSRALGCGVRTTSITGWALAPSSRRKAATARTISTGG